MTGRTAVHATFDLERTYSAPRGRVFMAFADAPQKRQWAHGAPADGYALDFRVGGREHVQMAGPGGGTFTYDGIYYDIVENERIIYAYSFSFGQGNAGTTLTAPPPDSDRFRVNTQSTIVTSRSPSEIPPPLHKALLS